MFWFVILGFAVALTIHEWRKEKERRFVRRVLAPGAGIGKPKGPV